MFAVTSLPAPSYPYVAVLVVEPRVVLWCTIRPDWGNAIDRELRRWNFEIAGSQSETRRANPPQDLIRRSSCASHRNGSIESSLKSMMGLSKAADCRGLGPHENGRALLYEGLHTFGCIVGFVERD